jgi:splicing factor 3B subunit 2
MGVSPEDMEKVEKGEMLEEETPEEQKMSRMHMGDYGYDDEEEEEEEEAPPASVPQKESKNKKRKKKKKRAKNRFGVTEHPVREEMVVEETPVDVEYVQERVDIDLTDPNFAQFARIFETFKIAEPERPKEPEKDDSKKEEKKQEVPIKARGLMSDSDEDEDEDDRKDTNEDKPRLSKKKMKKLNRLSVAELKQLVSRPDVVEMHDVTARDPKLLVHLKATRNTVPVPRHWCFKRKYLQGKRGIEKPPFELPEFIKATGIMEMRAALQEKEDQKSMKQKMRERVRPKMGKIDIDYQKLHDAFFRWQIKPKMTIHGDLYYEGKEFETRLKEKKPGNLSDELRTALGMPIGPTSDKVPPPWLIAMQRYGPPPSYPNLKIPGLNAPIPEGCSFGYHAGGWGKPPVDESGKPLYGDVFGTQGNEFQAPAQEEEIDRTRWGELESESESEEESSEEEEDEEAVDATGLVTPGETGLVTPSGLTSVPIGVETPDMIELRKRRIEDAMDQGGDTPALYTVLPEKKTNVGGAMMGSSHIYDISAVVGGGGQKKPPGPPGQPVAEGVEVALNPEELDLDTAAMQAKYEQTVREQQNQLEKEDLSDMVAEHAAKQKKRKKQQPDSGRTAKKYKEFKF